MSINSNQKTLSDSRSALFSLAALGLAHTCTTMSSCTTRPKGLRSCRPLVTNRMLFQTDHFCVFQLAKLYLSRSAICRGAVLKGFLQDSRPDQDNSPVKVTSTISRSSIGMEIFRPFDENKHLEEDKFWCDKELRYNAKNLMDWFLHKVMYLDPCSKLPLFHTKNRFTNLGVERSRLRGGTGSFLSCA